MLTRAQLPNEAISDATILWLHLSFTERLGGKSVAANSISPIFGLFSKTQRISSNDVNRSAQSSRATRKLIYEKTMQSMFEEMNN